MSRVTYPAAFPAAGAPSYAPTSKPVYRGGGGGISPEAQSVLDILQNLTPAEEAAVITFVNGNVADGNWAPIDCFFYYGLTSTVDDKLDWLANSTGNMVPIGTVPKVTHDGYAKAGGISNYLESGIVPSTDLVSASATDLLTAMFTVITNDFGANSPTPFGAQALAADDRWWLQMRGDPNDQSRIFPLTTVSALGPASAFDSPFVNLWLGMNMFGTADFIGGTAGAVAEEGIDEAIGPGNLPNVEMFVGARNNDGVADNASWQPTITSIVVTQASTFNLNAFSIRFATFKAAVDGQP